MGYPNFSSFFDIFLTKSETVLTFWLKKKYVGLKNKPGNDFKYRLDVKDLVKASLHWKTMSMSKFLSSKSYIVLTMTFVPKSDASGLNLWSLYFKLYFTIL